MAKNSTGTVPAAATLPNSPRLRILENKTFIMHETGTVYKREQRLHQRCILVAGRWRRLLAPLQYQYMVAQALNACVYHDLEQPEHGFRLFIHGYLLHGPDICLVLHIKKTHLPRMVKYFSEQLQTLLTAELLRQSQYNGGDDALQAAIRRLRQPGLRLFRQMPFTDEWLVRLITGRTVWLPYYDPHLAWLRQLVHNNPFCSALDYLGGQGPVVIQKLLI